MSFTDAAVLLAGQCALALGWRPDDFWRATPAELKAIVAAMTSQVTAPPDGNMLDKLKERFPDG